MKKILSVFLALTLILALSGCKKTNNTSSESELSSEPIISSNEEDVISIENNSSETTVVNSSEESKINSSTVTPSTNVNSKVNSNETTVSTNNSSQTTVENKPTTYFEKNNLKLSAFTTNVCFNTEQGHICGTHKTISIKKDKLSNLEWIDTYSEYISKGQINIAKYIYIMFETYDGFLDDDYSDCCTNFMYYVFDKYTGVVFDPLKWIEITYNEKTYKIISILDGGGGGYYTQSIYCPEDYDGAIFAKTESYDYFDDGKLHTIDEYIDFENDKYYLFAANS